MIICHFINIKVLYLCLFHFNWFCDSILFVCVFTWLNSSWRTFIFCNMLSTVTPPLYIRPAPLLWHHALMSDHFPLDWHHTLTLDHSTCGDVTPPHLRWRQRAPSGRTLTRWRGLCWVAWWEASLDNQHPGSLEKQAPLPNDEPIRPQHDRGQG